MSDQSKRQIIFELPSDMKLEADEIEGIAAQFKSQLIDQKAGDVLIQAQPQAKVKEVPVIVQYKEVPVVKQVTTPA